MKILIVSNLAENMVIKDVEHIPSQGEYIDMFYRPVPKIDKVIHFPSPETLEKLDPDHKIMGKLDYISIKALLFVC